MARIRVAEGVGALLARVGALPACWLRSHSPHGDRVSRGAAPDQVGRMDSSTLSTTVSNCEWVPGMEM